MGVKILGYFIIFVFASLFLILSSVLFSVTPKEYYLLATIFNIILLVIGVKILANIRIPGEKKDL